ncbi:MAG: DUF427 domain-containing protein [Maritimibacter sp.]|nr:DUF427 domain-containing protein [Maritimibacter sp.]
MSDAIEIRPKPGHVVVVAGGAVLGETDRALELIEDGFDPVVYFPRDDLAMVMLDASAKRTSCPKKGEASYYSIQTKSTVLKDAAWSYEAPIDGAAAIAGYIAFAHPSVNVLDV